MVFAAERRLDSIFAYDENAGAPGFEPGITGPKPVALPLGYAPIRLSKSSFGS